MRDSDINIPQALENERFVLSFGGESKMAAVLENWGQLLDTVYREVYVDDSEAQTEFHARLIEPDNWNFDDWGLPFEYNEDVGEMSSMCITRINSAAAPGGGMVGVLLIKKPVTDEFLAKLGGKEELAGSGFKYWDFVYAKIKGDPRTVITMLRIHSPQCQPGDGACVELYDPKQGIVEGMTLFNNYCHTVGDVLELLRILKIRHANPWE